MTNVSQIPDFEDKEKRAVITTVQAENQLILKLREFPLEPKKEVFTDKEFDEALEHLKDLSWKYKIIVVGSPLSINLLGKEHNLVTLVKGDANFHNSIVALMETEVHPSSVFGQSYAVFCEYDLTHYVSKKVYDAHKATYFNPR